MINGVRKKIRLGDVLIQEGKITQEQLDTALKEQKIKGKLLGDTLVDLGYVSQDDMIDVLCRHLNVEYVNVAAASIDEKAVKMIDEENARRLKLIPYMFDKSRANVIWVAMADPMDIMAIDDASIITGMEVVPVLSKLSDIQVVIDKFFGKAKALAVAEAYKQEQGIYDNAETQDDERREDVENSPIVQLVRNVIEQAARQRASDIHIEPFEYSIRVRYRIDGTLNEAITYDKALYSAMIARIKIISGMDISEKRKPQDGRITIDIDHKEYDIRVSCLPTCYGEKVVMRLALKAGFKREKSKLGLKPDDMIKFDNILKNPHGIILVTGPTGSGKSTTLYTALSELNKIDVNIITVEDPVEANIDGINQVMVNNKADLTFASALRSILRQDPDIIMIGEIRDSETAEIAVKASITGHLVVSTLHTNNTASSVSRLIDMCVEPYLLSDSLVGIIAQRLVRRLCECSKDNTREATIEEKKALGVPLDEPCTLHEPKGCKLCNNIGYYGRIGVYEIMPITKRLKRMIADKRNADDIMDAAVEEGMHTLRASAAEYVLDGTTTFSEMMKITYNVDN